MRTRKVRQHKPSRGPQRVWTKVFLAAKLENDIRPIMREFCLTDVRVRARVCATRAPSERLAIDPALRACLSGPMRTVPFDANCTIAVNSLLGAAPDQLPRVGTG